MTVAIKTRDLKLAATSVVASGIHPPLAPQKKTEGGAVALSTDFKC